MNWKTHKKQLLKDPEFKKAYEEADLELQIAKSVIEARMHRGITQKELAQQLHTKQSVISRVENAKTTPSLSFLKRLAEVFDTSLHIRFVATASPKVNKTSGENFHPSHTAVLKIRKK